MTSVDVREPAIGRLQRGMYWLGWIVSAMPTFVVVTSSYWKLTESATYVKEFLRIGWPHDALPVLAGLQLGALALYWLPPTSVLGAVLLTGYLGGAVASYVRIGEWSPPLVPFTTAVLAWLGLWLRDARLRALLPFRTGKH